MASNNEFIKRLGSDLKYPIKGTFEATSGLALLIQDIERLLLTIPGERPMRPEFGCYLRNQIWENLEEGAQTGVAEISTALTRFEPRITLIDVVAAEVNLNTGLVVFNIQFIVNNTDQSMNLVFPFRSGSDLSFA